MKIDNLIRLGRLDPILEIDVHGIEMLIGWRRKDGSRKDGQFMLKHPQPWIVRGDLTPGVRIVIAERKRQVQFEGFDAERDDKYANAELARAAQCYEQEASARKLISYIADEESGNVVAIGPVCEGKPTLPESWPWPPAWWKPADRIRDLAKAGALYLAEADRLRRAGEADKSELVTKQALGCAAGIDNLYRVTPLSPGPHMIHAA